MKTYNKILVLILSITFILSGCTKKESMDFMLATGDKIEITLDKTDNNYKFKLKNNMLHIVENDENIMVGQFLTEEMYENMISILNAKDYKIISQDTKSNCDYIKYTNTGLTSTNNSILCWFSGSNTGIYFNTDKNKTISDKIFDSLEFKVLEVGE